MRFLVDEDVAIEAARCRRQAGHEVLLAPEVLGVRTDDVDIWHHAVQTQSIVVTGLCAPSRCLIEGSASTIDTKATRAKNQMRV